MEGNGKQVIMLDPCCAHHVASIKHTKQNDNNYVCVYDSIILSEQNIKNSANSL